MHNKLISPDKWGVHRLKQGLQLVDLEKSKLKKHEANLPILADLFKLPLSIYFLNQQSQLKTCNTINLGFLQTDNLKQVYNKSAYDIYKNNHCLQILENDRKVIVHQQRYFFDEQCQINNQTLLNCISMKLPWFNSENKIIGIAGFSIFNQNNSLATSLTLLSQLGFLNSEKESLARLPGLSLKNIYISRRELEVLEHVVRGKSARLIALDLDISKRTVETHIEHIKNKLGVTNKSELIEKALEYLKFT